MLVKSDMRTVRLAALIVCATPGYAFGSPAELTTEARALAEPLPARSSASRPIYPRRAPPACTITTKPGQRIARIFDTPRGNIYMGATINRAPGLDFAVNDTTWQLTPGAFDGARVRVYVTGDQRVRSIVVDFVPAASWQTAVDEYTQGLRMKPSVMSEPGPDNRTVPTAQWCDGITVIRVAWVDASEPWNKPHVRATMVDYRSL